MPERFGQKNCLGMQFSAFSSFCQYIFWLIPVLPLISVRFTAALYTLKTCDSDSACFRNLEAEANFLEKRSRQFYRNIDVACYLGSRMVAIKIVEHTGAKIAFINILFDSV